MILLHSHQSYVRVELRCNGPTKAGQSSVGVLRCLRLAAGPSRHMHGALRKPRRSSAGRCAAAHAHIL